MSLRIFNAALCLLVAGCGSSAEDRSGVPEANGGTAQNRDDSRQIDCAVARTNRFVRTCTIDKIGGALFILRHPDGGFQRITLANDGTIDVADGSARPSGRSLADGRFELEVDGKRYRLPADLQ